MDLDADGHPDLLTATFAGLVYVLRGSAEGWRAPERVLDAAGRAVDLGLHFDFEAGRFVEAKRDAPGATGGAERCVAAAAVDWDADGDLDLLLGAKEGRLYLRRNEGTARAPRFAAASVRLEQAGAPLLVPGGLASARIVDWNGDGLFDVVCGSSSGGAYLLCNTGRPGAPRLAAPATLVPGPGERGGPTYDWTVEPVDYDGDGRLDLLVGGSRPGPSSEPEFGVWLFRGVAPR